MNVNVTGPGATLALGLMFMKTNNAYVYFTPTSAFYYFSFRSNALQRRGDGGHFAYMLRYLFAAHIFCSERQIESEDNCKKMLFSHQAKLQVPLLFKVLIPSLLSSPTDRQTVIFLSEMGVILLSF